MRAILPLTIAGLILMGFTLGDESPLFNAYEILRWTGATFLPEVGTRYFVYQEKLGQAALPAAWALWILTSVLLSYVITKALSLLR